MESGGVAEEPADGMLFDRGTGRAKHEGKGERGDGGGRRGGRGWLKFLQLPPIERDEGEKHWGRQKAAGRN
jgi:hypothetical protein